MLKTMKSLFGLLGICFLLSSTSCQNDESERKLPEKTSTQTEEKDPVKFHELVLIWIKDPIIFQQYAEQVTPIVKKYGGELDKMFAPTGIWAEGVEQPDLINLVHYRSREDYQRFLKDPDFLKIKALRDQGIRMMAFQGNMTLENPTMTGAQDRMYNVELVNYKGGDPKAYHEYMKRGEGKMSEYGFQTEYLMEVVSHDAPLIKPDIAKVSYFESQEGMKGFESDPMHKVIEEELYPAAIDQVIWITGKIHPLMMEMN